MSDALREHLHPIMLPLLDRHQAILRRRFGIATIVQETWRDPKTAQLAAYLKGRDPVTGAVVDPAAVVTNARPGQSWHGITYPSGKPASLAYHLGIDADTMDAGVQYLGFGQKDLYLDGGPRLRCDLDGREPLDELGPGHLVYAAIMLVGESLGLTAGARWQSRDWMHVELRVGTLQKVQADMRNRGDIVWPVTA